MTSLEADQLEEEAQDIQRNWANAKGSDLTFLVPSILFLARVLIASSRPLTITTTIPESSSDVGDIARLGGVER